MRTLGVLLIGWAGLGLLATMAGCQKKTEAGSDTPAASINGGTAAQAEKDKAPSNVAKPTKTAGPSSDPNHPVVEIDTSLGKVTVTLDKEHSPLTVDNFLSYVGSGHYDGTIFHQVLKDYVIMGGAYTSDLKEKPSRTPIRNEAENRQKNVRGTVAMVRRPDVKDSSTCQFFINVSDNPNLDYEDSTAEKYGYCVFGRVSPESMTVVDKIAAVSVADKPNFERIPDTAVVIKSVHRVH